MTLQPIFDPEVRKPGPKPANVDLKKTFIIGTIIWAVALAVIAVLLFVFNMQVVILPFLTCILGVVIGVCLLIWEKWYRPEYRKLAAGN
ncbi:MAG: DUF2530 domain-containing protein [Bifidobacteriaceae bacterium]|jgi:uncharacterized membrane protein|nr:DUF2530 domain-containing protein [Bifidobacteriaceae bacterium]MCI1979550.1 DUF2530 domain-containing protein [Bifidobacteriaceae bacterium]